MLEAALILARNGVAVFPCGVDKAPLTSHGFKDATTDEETISSWGWPMIGAAISPGTFVLDVDPRNGGADTIAMLVTVNGSLPGTRRTRTQSGGDHWWYRVPPALQLRGTLGPGVDVKRAGKGYVIVPPSPGYIWARGGALARAPEWLLEELVVTPQDASEHERAEPKFFVFEHGTAYGLAALRNSLAALSDAPQGSRNDALNKAAFGLAQLEAGGEISRTHAAGFLLDRAVAIGLNRAESMKTIESGWLAGEQIPRQAPKRVIA
jgi:hypothetical protein